MTRNFYFAALLLLSSLCFAADNRQNAKPQLVKGHLVDVACALENAQKPKADFAVKHNKECLQMAECRESGFAVLTPDNKLIKFDAAGNEFAKKFIARTDKDADWKVAVTGNVNGDTMSVTGLELQK